MDIQALSYIVVSASDIASWRDYGTQLLGMMATDAPGDGLYLKMDERDFRFLIIPGDSDHYFASGWELVDAAAFEAAVAKLLAAGVEVHSGTDAETASRRVQELAWFLDPAGNRHEIGWGIKSDFLSFVSPVGVPRFITGDMGLGHAVLPAPNFDDTYRFLHDVMGFGLSDILRHRFTTDPAEPEKRIYFLHCANPRHHSLAIFEMDIPAGCVHAMVQVEDMDQVGRALDRVHAQGAKLSATLGRHCNDRMISFYVKTPGGFDMEFGYGGERIDWSEHTVYESTKVSLWGHDFSIGAE